MSDELIELHAIYRKTGAVLICDQHGRGFKHTYPDMLTLDQREHETVIERVEMISPQYPTDRPHVEVTIRVPLEVEERLPEFMLEFLGER